MKLSDALDTVFFTADWHLGHTNILNFCNRPFKNIDEHDTALIANANNVVGEKGVCYHLGDFAFKNETTVVEYRSQLLGEWHFVSGGHDRWIAKSSITIIEPPLLTLNFETSYKHPLAVVLCHYAMRRWDRSHYGSYHLYGHSHGSLPGYGRSMDVGVDCWNYTPVSLRYILDVLRKEGPTTHH